MFRSVRLVVFVLCATLIAAPALAQEPPADVNYQKALVAEKDGHFDQALDFLEQAYRAEPKPRYIHRRILVLEKMGEYKLALDVLEDYRQKLVDAPDVHNLAVLEQRLHQELAQKAAGGDDRAHADVFGWSLVGGGAVLLAGGVASLFYAEGEAEKLRCSPGSTAAKTGCSGVDAYGAMSANEFDQKSGHVTTFRLLGGGLSAVGVAAVGWGIYRLVDTESSAQADAGAARTQVRATFDARGGAGLELLLHF